MPRKRNRPSPPRPLSQREMLALQISDREKGGLMSATVERTLQAGGELDLEGTEKDGKERRQLVSVSIIDRLRTKKLLEPRLYEAGDQLRRDQKRAGLDGSFPQIGFEVPVSADRHPVETLAGFVNEETLDARRRYRKAVEAVGPHLCPILNMAIFVAPNESLGHVGAVLYGRAINKATEAAATENLRIALRALADHYYGPEKQRGTHFYRDGDIVVHRRAG